MKNKEDGTVWENNQKGNLSVETITDKAVSRLYE